MANFHRYQLGISGKSEQQDGVGEGSLGMLMRAVVGEHRCAVTRLPPVSGLMMGS
jgi:hypothetical protein